MVVTEHYSTRADGIELVRTYSDKGMKLLQVETGITYDEAIDVSPCKFTYMETDEPAEIPDETAAKAAAYDVLMGVRE